MLGQKLKQLREEKRFSTDELADAAKISRQTLWNIETGKVDPKTSTLLALAAALEVQPSIFFDSEVKSTLREAI